MKTAYLSGVAACAFFMIAPGAAHAQALSADEAAALRAEVAALKAQVDRLEARLNALPAKSASEQVASATGAPATGGQAKPETKIGWKGSPQFTSGEASFKVKGRIQLDAGYVSAPSSVADRALGFSNEARRIRLGAEGALGGKFGYKLETELSDSSVELVDTFITYDAGKLLVTLGNHNGFQSLDELISDTQGSVMERAAFTDAFGFERRLGLSVQYRNGPWLAQGGIFTDSVDSLLDDEDGDENNSFGLDGRLVFAPKLGGTQLHLGGSYHWRDFQRLSAQPVRYRQRAFLHSINSRFLATQNISAKGESHYGFELAAVRGPLHFAGEGHWLRVARQGLSDPLFFGAYAEVGYYLTRGDTRGYKNGILTTADPKRPVSEGGPGAIQLNFRYDYLDLNDQTIVGGKQNAYIASIIWTPINYLRFNLNYAHIAYEDAAILAGTRSDYGVNVAAVRAELDF